MIELRPIRGRTLGDVEKTLTALQYEAQNKASMNVPIQERIDDYVRWTTTAALHLTHLIQGSGVEQIVYSPHYYALLQSAGSTRAVNQLQSELAAVASRLEGLATQARELNKYWIVGGVSVVLDTNHLVQTTELFDKIDWPKELRIVDHVQLVIPMRVIDELDRLKRDQKVRTHARLALRKLEELLTAPGRRQTIASGGSNHRFATTVDVLREPPGYVGIEDNDTEIVSRATWLADLGCAEVRFATWDTGPRFRAAGEGIATVSLPEELERE